MSCWFPSWLLSMEKKKVSVTNLYFGTRLGLVSSDDLSIHDQTVMSYAHVYMVYACVYIMHCVCFKTCVLDDTIHTFKIIKTSWAFCTYLRPSLLTLHCLFHLHSTQCCLFYLNLTTWLIFYFQKYKCSMRKSYKVIYCPDLSPSSPPYINTLKYFSVNKLHEFLFPISYLLP